MVLYLYCEQELRCFCLIIGSLSEIHVKIYSSNNCLKINCKELIWGMIIVRVFVSTQVCRLSFHYHSIPGGSGTFSVLLVYMKGKATKKDTMNVGLYPRSFQKTSGYIIG